MAPAAPGIFTDASGAIIPASTVSRGGTATVYLTGAGALQPVVATGATPVSGTTPVPTQTFLVTVGGVQATTAYIGVPNFATHVPEMFFVWAQSVSPRAMR